MSAAEHEYDVCAVEGCHGVPVATWQIEVKVWDVWVSTIAPACQSHDASMRHSSRDYTRRGVMIRPIN